MVLLLWLQRFSHPWLDAFFLAVTSLGSREFYMTLIPLVYWCVDRRVGLRLGLAFLVSIYLNFFLKDLLRLPRPAGPGLRVLSPERDLGYGFPSGHAQGNATVWGYLAAAYRRRWLTVLAALLVTLVSLSRLYLGVHYPADVAGGIALGLGVVAGFRAAEGALARRTWPPWLPPAAALAIPLGAAALYPTADGFRITGMAAGLAEGHLLAGRAAPHPAFGESAPSPASPAAPGEKAHGRAPQEAPRPAASPAAPRGIVRPAPSRWSARPPAAGTLALRAVTGLAGLFLLYLATGALFPDGPAQLLRYALLGRGISWAAPRLFALLGLGDAGNPARPGADRP